MNLPQSEDPSMKVTMSETNKEEANNYMCTSDSDEEMYQQNSTYNTSADKKRYQLQLYMIGTRIIKEFKGVYFKGQVAGFHYLFYRIVYCDGDREDLNPGEVQKMLKPKVKAKLKNAKNVTVFTGPSINSPMPGQIYRPGIPNMAHLALKELMDKDLVKFVVSTNVDGLHRKSGISKERLFELNGNYYKEVCKLCNRDFVRDFMVYQSST